MAIWNPATGRYEKDDNEKLWDPAKGEYYIPQNQNNNLDNNKKESKKQKDSFFNATNKFVDTMKNSAVANHGFNISNVITDAANIYDASKQVTRSLPFVGKPLQVKDKIDKTVLNTATNMGEGALRTGEGILDTANSLSDKVINGVSYQGIKALYGKERADKWLKEAKESTKEFVKKDLTTGLLNKTGYNDEKFHKEFEQDSLVKRDNLEGQVAQGVGGMVPSLLAGQYLGLGELPTKELKGLQGLDKATQFAKNLGMNILEGLPSTTVLANSTYGQSLQEAYQNGATEEQATKYAIGSTAKEIATEWITGGIPGLNRTGGLDKPIEKLIDKTTGKLKNEYGKAIAKSLMNYGYKFVGEGLEEELSEIIDPFLKNATYSKDEKVNWEEVLNSFIVGGIIGGILEAPNSIAELGNNLVEAKNKTDMKKAALPTPKVQNIDNNVESTEGNPLMENKSQIALPIPENTLQNKMFKNNEQFVYEPSENIKVDNFRKSANQFMNNSNETKSFVNTVEKVINDKNYNITFDNTIGENVNGRISINENGEVDIRINPNSDRAGEFILTHEITHAIDTEDMKNLVIDYASKNKEFSTAIESLKETYGTDNVNEEVLADISGQLFGNEEFVNKLSASKPSLFKRIYDKIISFANKITGNSKESLFIKDLKNKWEKAYRESSIENAKENLNVGEKFLKAKLNSNEDVVVSEDILGSNPKLDDVKSVLEKMLGKSYYNESSNNNLSIERKDINKFLHDGYNNIKNERLKKRIAGNYGEILELAKIDNNSSGASNYKGTNRGKKGFDYYNIKLAYPIKDNNQNILDYKVYDGRLVVRKENNGDFSYDIDGLKQNKKATVDKTSLSISADETARGFSNNDNISQNTENVNKNDALSNKYSMQNTENNTWQEHLEENYKSKGTRTYFENTKFNKENNSVKYLDPTKESSYGPVKKKGKIYNLSKVIEFNDYKHQEDYKNLISKYDKNTTKEQIKADLEENFKTKRSDYSKETGEHIKYLIGRDKIFVSDELKEKFSNFSNFAKNNVGDIKFSPEGKDVIEIYNQLNKKYPSVFENDFYKDITKKIDSYKNDYNVDVLDQLENDRLNDVRAKMLSRMSEFIHEDPSNYESYKFDNKILDNVSDYIYDAIQKNENIDDIVSQFDMSPRQIRKEKTQEFRNYASKFIKDSANWIDKKIGLSYKAQTMKRNFYDTMGRSDGENIYHNFIEPIFNHNKQVQDEITKYNKKIKSLKLSDIESAAVQMFGEYKYNPETLVTWSEVDNIITENKLDHKKIENAVEVFRKTYDELLERENLVLSSLGFKPIDYREGYFPHFIESQANTKIGKALEKIGFNFDDSTLPTDIAGITDQFKPGKIWNRNAQQRLGKITDYNALKGFDNYIRNAMNTIYFTEDIQKLRALENEIRYQHSSKKVQEDIDRIFNDSSLDFTERQEQLEKIFATFQTPLNNLVTELRDYTNNIANKKSVLDRTIEQATNRNIYTIMNNVNSRVSANMVGLNLSSAITNFIPITQAMSQVKSKYLFQGLKEAIKTQVKSDNFESKSVFLTTRLNEAEKLSKTNLEKISDKMNFLFNAIDSITSNAIVRGKYYENKANNMSEFDSMRNADEFARDIMAGRAKGEMPTIFNSKNPLLKTFTAFQLEVNNQYQYMFKDLPRDLKDDGLKKLLSAYLKMFFGAWAYNQISEKLVGRNSAFSPTDTVLEICEISKNKNLNFSDKVTKATKTLTQDVPFIGGVLGGGRLPISAALPSASTLTKSAGKLLDGKKDNNKEALIDTGKEALKPLLYVGLPFGGGQLKKSVEGASMYLNNKDIKGSYNSKGELKFEAKKDPLSVAKNILFGPSSSKEAQEYYSNGYAPIDKKTLDKLKKKDISINEFRQYSNHKRELGLNEIKSDRDSENKIIKGSSSAKKALKIMNSDYSEKEKDYLLSTLAANDESPITSKEIKDLKKDEKTYKFYFGENDDGRKTFRNELKDLNLSSDNLIDYYNERKQLKDTYASVLAKEKIMSYVNNLNTDEKTKWYLYNKDYEDEHIQDVADKFNIKFNDYSNVINYYNNISNQYKGSKNSSIRKRLVFDHINSLKISKIQKCILYKKVGYNDSTCKNYIFNYIESMNLSKTEKTKIYNYIY